MAVRRPRQIPINKLRTPEPCTPDEVKSNPTYIFQSCVEFPMLMRAFQSAIVCGKSHLLSAEEYCCTEEEGTQVTAKQATRDGMSQENCFTERRGHQQVAVPARTKFHLLPDALLFLPACRSRSCTMRGPATRKLWQMVRDFCGKRQVGSMLETF